MKNILILLILAIGITSYGQDLKREELVGKWITSDLVIDFGDMKPKDENILKGIKKGFINSEFDLRDNGKFYIKFPEDTPTFMQELVFLNDKNWKVENNALKVGTESDHYNLMHIRVLKENGKTYFIMPGMKLEMKKI